QEDARRVAARALGKKLSDGEVSTYFYRLGWRWILDQPGRAGLLFLRKLAYCINAAHLSLNYSYPFYAHDANTLLPALFVGAGLLVPLGISGLITAAPPMRRTDYLVLASFVPLYVVS